MKKKQEAFRGHAASTEIAVKKSTGTKQWNNAACITALVSKQQQVESYKIFFKLNLESIRFKAQTIFSQYWTNINKVIKIPRT